MDSMLMITRRASDPKMLMMALISKNYKIGKKNYRGCWRQGWRME